MSDILEERAYHEARHRAAILMGHGHDADKAGDALMLNSAYLRAAVALAEHVYLDPWYGKAGKLAEAMIAAKAALKREKGD